MAATNALGKEAERLALLYLIENGYEILHSNWMYGHEEIDIIAMKEDRLHFVEVKSRRFYPGCYPENNVTRKKFRHLLRAADEYMYQNPGFTDVEFNILSIVFHKDAEVDYFFIRDVYL